MNERCTLDRASATVASWFGVSVWQGEEKEWSVIFLFILFIYLFLDQTCLEGYLTEKH